MRQHEKEETALFYIGWAAIAFFCCVWIFYRLFPIPISKFLLPCVVQSTFGIYCPGCGGTRAVMALLRGNFTASFISHPLVLYTAVIGGWFLLSQTIERLSRHRLKCALKYRDGYVWAALIIVIANFILKNLLLFVFHIDLLKNIRL